MNTTTTQPNFQTSTGIGFHCCHCHNNYTGDYNAHTCIGFNINSYPPICETYEQERCSKNNIPIHFCPNCGVDLKKFNN